jgi:hypothetical protein
MPVYIGIFVSPESLFLKVLCLLFSVLIASLFCILYSFCSALASLHLTKCNSLFIGIFVLLNLQPWFEFIFHHCMAWHNALFGCLLSWNCGISYVSTSGYFDY